MNEVKRPLNGDEQVGACTIVAVSNSLPGAIDALNRRLSREDRRKLHTIITYADNVTKSILDQLELGQKLRFAANLKSKIYRVGSAPYSKASLGTDMIVVANQDLKVLCETAVNECCAVCTKTGTEARRCKLRKVLDDMMCIEVSDNPNCWYRII